MGFYIIGGPPIPDEVTLVEFILLHLQNLFFVVGDNP